MAPRLRSLRLFQAREAVGSEILAADAMVDEEHLDAACSQAGNRFPGVGQQAVAGPPALMPKPGNPQLIAHALISVSRSSRKGRFCNSAWGM